MWFPHSIHLSPHGPMPESETGPQTSSERCRSCVFSQYSYPFQPAYEGWPTRGGNPESLKSTMNRHRQVRGKRILDYFNYIIRYWKELAEEVTEPKLGLCLSTPAQWEPRFPLNSVCVIFLLFWPSQYISMLKTVYPSSFFTPGVCHQVAHKITLRTFSHQFFTLPP